MISLVVAYNQDRVIGAEGTIPWQGKLPADMKRFRDITMDHSVVMGRKTWDSLPDRFRPLSGRRNLILSGDPEFDVVEKGVFVYRDPSDIFQFELPGVGDEVVVIGGETIYRAFYHRAARMYITEIQTETIRGDAFFLADDQRFNPSFWEVVGREEHEPDEKNKYPYTFITYDRR